MNPVILLKGVDKNCTPLVGGKGAQLGELEKTGFNVPEGFVISTELYKDIMKTPGLSKNIQKILTSLDVENTEDLEKASTKIQSFITAVKLPAGVEEEILNAYRKIGGLVAVRSSATAEDLKDASFAGQLSTFLNVKEDELIKSVKKCLASLFTARAIYYRTQKKFSLTKISVAVVVQAMIGSKKAGVAFSVNPATNNSQEILIEAAQGLGEAVVSGRGTPDSYLVAKDNNQVKEMRTAGKHRILSDGEISRLSETIRKIENHYGYPQDVEWAIDENGILYVLQARPVTTFQVHKKPVWKKILSREYGVQYTELSLRCLTEENSFIVPTPFYEQIYVPEDGNEVCYIEESKWNGFVSALKDKYLGNPLNYGEFKRLFMETGEAYMKIAETISNSDLESRSDKELKDLYKQYLSKNIRYGSFIWIQFLINNFFADKTKEIITNKVGSDNKNLFDFIESALSPEKKAASIQLNEIAVKWDKLSVQEKINAWKKFKWVPCLDIHSRPWTKEEFFSHIGDFKKVTKVLSVSYKMMLKKIKPSPEEKRILDIARNLSYLKDLKDDFRRQGVFHGQKLFKEIARRMSVKLEEISYMSQAEIAGFLEKGTKIPRSVVKERKRGFVIYFTPERKIACKSGADIEPALNELGIIIFEEFSEEIKGIPSSPGKAKGVVKIVRGVSDLSKIKKGDIMIAVTTHPDYVPAMQRAAAIVTDEGGITSHASIVSRELGLPCIVGAQHATKSFKDGDRAEIDADAGFVRKIKK